MTVAVVLSGGASHGAIHVGMLRALREHGVRADVLIGTSAGALNAAWLATHPDESVEVLGDIWRGLSRDKVFPLDFVGGFLGFIGKRASLFSDRGMRSLLRHHIGVELLEDTIIPLHVVATDIRTGEELRLSEGSLVDAVTASASLPGLLPPVRWGEYVLVDGGLRNNTPISHAAEMDADEIYVLSTGYACKAMDPPESAAGVALQAISLLVSQRLESDVKHYGPTTKMHIPPGICMDVGPTDFAQADRLIQGAYQSTAAWLADGCKFMSTAFHHTHTLGGTQP